MVSGPVAYHSLDNDFKKIQALEFMSLIGTGAGAIGIQNAFMCNGANMAFRTSIFSNTENEKDLPIFPASGLQAQRSTGN